MEIVDRYRSSEAGRYVRLAGWGLAALLLATPLVMMQVSSEWQWTASDFAVAAAMLGVVGGGLELAARTRSRAYFAGAGLALMASFLLVWITGAVGFIGDEGTPPNLLFLGVIVLAFAGGVLARFRAGGMAAAMVAAGGAQAMIGIAAFVLRLGADEPPGLWGIQVLNAVFVALWLASAACFHLAGTRRDKA